jgi:hypothetical protein
MIFNDSEHNPAFCSFCEHNEFVNLGYDGDFDEIEARAAYKVFFLPEKFTPRMREDYWTQMTAEEKVTQQKKIEELNEKIRKHLN